MPTLIHEFRPPAADHCRLWQSGDGLTAKSDAVTCPECRQRQDDAGACPSRNKDGKRCSGGRGHGGLHHTETYGVDYVWSDTDSPNLATDL